MSLRWLTEVLERAQEGPLVSPKDWDMKVVYQKAKEKAAEHGLLKVYDPNILVNSDDGLADAFFRAGFELALDLGLLCTDTERLVKVSEEEVRKALEGAPSQLTVGSGDDAVTLEARKPEDGKKPKFTAPLAIVVSEDIWVKLMSGIAREREVDIFQGASLTTVFGQEVRSGTPIEIVAGKLLAQMHAEAMLQAGRPGIGVTAVAGAVTLMGQIGGFGINGGFSADTNLALILSPAELKTSFSSLGKVAHAIACGAKIHAAGSSFIGGFAGGVESTMITNIAGDILNVAVHQSGVTGCNAYDIVYNGNTGKMALWAVSVLQQAVTRSGHLITSGLINQLAGPATEMLLYESAVGLMAISCSGVSMPKGPRTAGGKYTDYLTPLECRFSGEVIHACPGMKRSDANEIAKSILPKYEDKLAHPPRGKSFRECYDAGNMEPSEEWVGIYRKVRKEMIDLGIPLA